MKKIFLFLLLFPILANADFLANLSTRATITPGVKIHAGIIVRGTPIDVFIRARGPSLNGIGLDGLFDPFFTVFDSSGTAIAFNDDSLLVHRLNPPNSLEPALLLTLEEGSYTVVVESFNVNDVGEIIVEVFDLDFF